MKINSRFTLSSIALASLFCIPAFADCPAPQDIKAGLTNDGRTTYYDETKVPEGYSYVSQSIKTAITVDYPVFLDSVRLDSSEYGPSNLNVGDTTSGPFKRVLGRKGIPLQCTYVIGNPPIGRDKPVNNVVIAKSRSDIQGFNFSNNNWECKRDTSTSYSYSCQSYYDNYQPVACSFEETVVMQKKSKHTK